MRSIGMAKPIAALAHLQPQAFPATGPESVFRYEDEHESGSRDGPTVRVGRGILGLGASSWICSPTRPPRSPRECCGPAGRPDGCGGCGYGRWRSPSGARSARRRRGGGDPLDGRPRELAGGLVRLGHRHRIDRPVVRHERPSERTPQPRVADPARTALLADQTVDLARDRRSTVRSINA